MLRYKKNLRSLLNHSERQRNVIVNVVFGLPFDLQIIFNKISYWKKAWQIFLYQIYCQLDWLIRKKVEASNSEVKIDDVMMPHDVLYIYISWISYDVLWSYEFSIQFDKTSQF